ncbi:MAG: 50S ribosomal protein P1 [Candidatus Woesearchaeota archaeon]|nr:MAG: 50S ribosomal protein P1 [Candidatus Woesearchaeota archaeon]
MEYIYSALLLHKEGQAVTEENVKKVIQAAGGKPNEARVKALIAALEGVNIEEAIKQASVPVAQPIVAQTGASAEAKKEEKKQEGKSAEEAAAGLGALFG